MNATRSLLRGAAVLAGALLAFSSTSRAQELYGRWEDDFAGVGETLEYYVSPSGDDLTGAGTPDAPWRSITRALSLAQVIWLDPAVITPPLSPLPIQITINVAPGMYDAENGEVFPLRCPAFGLSLETWPNGSTAGGNRPVIDPAFAETAILVDWVGNESIAPSVFQALEIQNTPTGIHIEPSLLTAGLEGVLAVEVRESFIHDAGFGIHIVTGPGFRSTHVIEDNDIGDETAVQGAGIREENSGVASTLYRSNRVQLYEFGIMIDGNGPTTTVPRLFSNFVQLGENLLEINDCSSFVVNNTIAFALDFTVIPEVNGVTIGGGFVQLHNNILWNPETPSGLAAIDLTISGAGTTQATNLIEDNAGGLTPGFVGGNIHPGFVAADLHLLPTSAMIGAGTNAQVFDPADTVDSTTAGSLFVRTDFPVDNDMDTRLFLSSVEAGPAAVVDLGGDEFLGLNPAGAPECRITMPNTPTQDSRGHVLAQPGGTLSSSDWTGTFTLSGPPNGLWFLLLGFGFFDAVADPNAGVVVPNGSVYQSLMVPTLPSMGSLQLDLIFQLNALNGSFNVLGVSTVPALALGTAPTSFAEAELYLQMLTFDPVTQRTAASNRQRVELNERP
ncbi:MAG: DUF1565 domain-containing protein [Planctomycetota bacterium]